MPAVAVSKLARTRTSGRPRWRRPPASRASARGRGRRSPPPAGPPPEFTTTVGVDRDAAADPPHPRPKAAAGPFRRTGGRGGPPGRGGRAAGGEVGRGGDHHDSKMPMPRTTSDGSGASAIRMARSNASSTSSARRALELKLDLDRRKPPTGTAQGPEGSAARRSFRRRRDPELARRRGAQRARFRPRRGRLLEEPLTPGVEEAPAPPRSGRRAGWSGRGAARRAALRAPAPRR